MKCILDSFRSHGQKASYHYACDSGAEDKLGFEHSNICRILWRNNPELHEQMKEIAKNFLFHIGD